MPLNVKLYFVTLLAFLAMDAVWLGLIARGFYARQLGFLLRDQPNWTAALVFYLLFVVGVVVFVVAPSLQSDSWIRPVLLGALFGVVSYAAYDLTNHATVNNWPWIVTVVDLCWGALVTASVSAVGFFAGKAWS